MMPRKKKCHQAVSPPWTTQEAGRWRVVKGRLRLVGNAFEKASKEAEV